MADPPTDFSIETESIETEVDRIDSQDLARIGSTALSALVQAMKNESSKRSTIAPATGIERESSFVLVGSSSAPMADVREAKSGVLEDPGFDFNRSVDGRVFLGRCAARSLRAGRWADP